MNHTTNLLYRRPQHRSRAVCLLVWILLLGGGGLLPAQQVTSVGNRFIRANVVTNDRSGKFGITAGPAGQFNRFLYQTVTLITSHVIFRVDQSNGTTRYACNVPERFGNGVVPRPRTSTGDVPFKPFDSVYVSADTIAVTWKNIYGYRITMRFVPEASTSVYDDGADMLLEFEYEKIIYSFARLGILLMLDTYNSQASTFSSGGFGDQTSIASDRGLWNVNTPGRVFAPPYDPPPDFYHIGNFLAENPMNTVFPIHKLRGTTRRGVKLTPPSLFVIDDWRRLRASSWFPPGEVGTESFADCATLTRWDSLVGKGVVRTSFGLNNRGSNDMFTCRNGGVFIDIRTKRVITQAVKNGPYDYEQFDVEMWVSNTSTQYAATPFIRLDEPIASIPNGTERLTLDGSTPAIQRTQLGPGMTQKLRWRLNVNRNSSDTQAIVRFSWRRLVEDKFGPFTEACEPLVTVLGFIDPPPDPPKDTVAPVIEPISAVRDSTALWVSRVMDRHLNFDFDTGIDTIRVLENLGDNFTFTADPLPFLRCDTSQAVLLFARVKDTTIAGRLIYEVADCNRNLSFDTIIYRPRPDTFPPTFTTLPIGAEGGTDCNARSYHVTVGDSVNQFPFSGDHGLGTIEVLGPLVNFTSPDINFDNGGVPINKFDRRATFRLNVIDTMLPGAATIRIADFAGNDTTLTLAYCPLPDTAAPRAVAQFNADPPGWNVILTDTLPWDRGLLEVVPIANPGNNVTFTPPTIPPGAPVALLPFISVNDPRFDAEITLEARDSVWTTNPTGHATRFTLRFSKIPDTLAPNIIFTPVPGTYGSVADVEVNDIHVINSEVYKYDVGLGAITVTSLSSNIMLASPITFSPGDKRATFRVQVIDTLAFNRLDSICLEAVDLAGNRSSNCYFYPVTPDVHAPIFTGTLSTDRTTITATITDQRLYDRGLGSLRLINEENLESGFAITNLGGAFTAQASIRVIDPEKPIAGTLLLRDLVADRDNSVESQAVHAVELPFRQAAVGIGIRLPGLVEGGEEIRGAVIATTDIDPAEVQQIAFTAQFSGQALFAGALGNGFAAVPDPTNGALLRATIEVQNGKGYRVGDTLGVLRFAAGAQTEVMELRLAIVPNTTLVNGGVGRVIAVQKLGDPLASTLALPPVFAKVSADSVTVINGYCDRVLATTGANNKAVGMAILQIRPQPNRAGETVTLEVRSLPSDARIELVAADGRVVERFNRIEPTAAGAISRVVVQLPSGLSAGAYLLRIIGGGTETGERIVVRQ
ncbi:MAG: T9SS type A sorting domain-containing protein [Candidatus Kapabacteria bacterium]|nr:MAG: hypothetical protein UZ07_CHB004001371 [Chlorobi bacterium OLB7]MBX7217818.1 T9SS type A sorting domain-containing protein [Candidatus Kapabacteria bacterium]